jgi:hypothetical protein
MEGLELEFKVSGKTARIATQEMESGLGGAALATAGVAAGLNAVASLLSNMGHERGAEGFEALASGASIAATALSVLPGLLTTIGASTAAVPWVAALIGVISLGVAISKWVETGEEKLERLNKEAQEAADAANEAKQAYEGLLSKESEYSGL